MIIATLHGEGHQGPFEQGFIDNRLHGTDVSELVLVSLIIPQNWCCTSSNLPQIQGSRCSLSAGFSGDVTIQGRPPVAGDATRPSELPQENQDVLKKLREMKLGANVDHAHSISIGGLGGKYYLMIVS